MGAPSTLTAMTITPPKEPTPQASPETAAAMEAQRDAEDALGVIDFGDGAVIAPMELSATDERAARLVTDGEFSSMQDIINGVTVDLRLEALAVLKFLAMMKRDGHRDPAEADYDFLDVCDSLTLADVEHLLTEMAEGGADPS